MKWALSQLREGMRHDPRLEPTAYRLERVFREDLPRMERLVPAAFGHLGFDYAPLLRFSPDDGGFPQVQLGPGVFTVNAAGSAYEFKGFHALVERRVGQLRGNVAEGDGDFAPVEFGFALLNRFDLAAWDIATGHDTSPTLASAFLRDQLGLGIAAPFDNLDGAKLYRQEVSRTYTLPRDLGLLRITARDVSESEGRQLVDLDQSVTVSTAARSLALLEAPAWLAEVHEYTKEAFLRLRRNNALLDEYLMSAPDR